MMPGFMMQDTRYKNIFYSILIILVLCYLYFIVGIDELLSTLTRLDPGLFFFLATLQMITQILLAYRLQLLIRALKYRIGFMKLFAIHLAGALVENITPAAKAGSEPARVYLLHKEGILLKDAFTVTLVGKYVDMIPFTVLLLLSYTYLATQFILPAPLIVAIQASIVLIIFLGTSGVIFLYRNEKIAVKILRNAMKILHFFTAKRAKNRERHAVQVQVQVQLDAEAEAAVKNFKRSLFNIVQDKAVLTISLSASIIVWLLYPLKIYVIFYTLGTDISFGIVACVTFLAYLVGLIPLLPGGLGIYEGSAIALYSILGISLADATVAVIIGRLFTFWFVILLGTLAAIILKIKTNSEYKTEEIFY